ncbi:C2H2-type domain-containing protein [Fusarium sp. Ph1]|nr:C2H2-type domain-containing protein [Fusarium sp. Ph1]
MAGMEPSIESPTPPGQQWILCYDSISPPSVSSSQGSYHYTKRPVEDGRPIAQGLSPSPWREKQKPRFACPFRKLSSLLSQGGVGSKRELPSRRQLLRHIGKTHRFSEDPPRARTRKKKSLEPRVESMLQLQAVVAYLRATAPPSTDTEDEPPVWFMENEIGWVKMCDRLTFLFDQLAVCIIVCSGSSCLWSYLLWYYSEFPGRIRPPCTTMPWIIWPALMVLWGVCWMFYSSPGRTTGVTEPQDQSFLDYQLQPEGIGGELLLSGLNDVDLVSHSFWDPSFSDEWWTPQQPSTIYDPLIMTLDHDMEACPPDIKRPARPDIDGQSSSNVQLQSQSQESGAVTEDIIDNIVATTSRPITTSRLKCPDCDKILSRHDSLKRHQQTQHNREVEEHLCPHKSCKRSRQGSGFSRPDGLRRHLKACKSRRTRGATLVVESVDIQPDSGNETREESQAPSSGRDTRSIENPDDANHPQSSSDSLIVGLRRRLAEAEAACDRAKREYEEAQRKVANYQTTIEMLEKERTA